VAGANLTGELRNPGKAIPRGTSGAILCSSLTYALVFVVCAATGTRLVLYDYQSVDYEGLVSAWRPLVTIGLCAGALSTSVGMSSA
jgi:potassium/chloride transporter 9